MDKNNALARSRTRVTKATIWCTTAVLQGRRTKQQTIWDWKPLRDCPLEHKKYIATHQTQKHEAIKRLSAIKTIVFFFGCSFFYLFFIYLLFVYLFISFFVYQSNNILNMYNILTLIYCSTLVQSIKMVPPGFEPGTLTTSKWCDNQLHHETSS